MTDSFFHIAIDGPVAAGKGTVSRLVSKKLQFLYVDTGAMYRMTAFLAHSHSIPYSKENKIVELIKNCKMEMRNPTKDEQDGRLTTVFLDGEDVSWKIRTKEIGQGASKVAILSEVRKILVKKQKLIAQNKDIIMEGRDITHKVLPKADLKIYLTAKTEERAKRRLLQFQQKGFSTSLEEVISSVKRRDKRDMSRATDPLKIVPDAWKIDTSELDIEEVVDLIVEKVNKMRSK